MLACQPGDDIFGQLSQVKRGIGKREEFLRVLIHRTCLPHDHVVQISSKDRQRKLSRLHILTELHGLMPRGPGGLIHACCSFWYGRGDAATRGRGEGGIVQSRGFSIIVTSCEQRRSYSSERLSASPFVK